MLHIPQTILKANDALLPHWLHTKAIAKFDLSDNEFDNLIQHKKALGTGFGLPRTKQRGAHTMPNKVARTQPIDIGTPAPDPFTFRAYGRGGRLCKTTGHFDAETERTDEITLANWMVERVTANPLQQRLDYANRLWNIRADWLGTPPGCGLYELAAARPAPPVIVTTTASLGYSAADAWFRKNYRMTIETYQAGAH